MTLYAYTGTWLADFPANHYTHFVGLLLQPSQEEVSRREQEIQTSNLLCSADGSDDEGGSRGCCCLDPPGTLWNLLDLLVTTWNHSNEGSVLARARLATAEPGQCCPL